LNEKFTPYIFILFFTLIISGTRAQDLKLSIKTNQDSDQEVLNHIPFKKELPSKVALENEIDSLFDKLQFRGYLNAKLDTVMATDTLYTAFFSLGEKIKSVKIYYGHISSSLLSKKDLSLYFKEITDTYFEIPFSEIQTSMQTLADHFEKKGNSFIRVSLHEIMLINGEATAQLILEDNQQRTIDKVIVKGYENFPKSYILHELRLKTGSLFNKEKLKQASQAIVNLAFVEELKPPEVLFTPDSTLVYLYLKKKRSNQFDGIIGFASKEESSGLEFNGYLDLAINNIFNSGETIALYWKNNGNDSQRFFLEAELPYIFNLPLIPKANFQLYRQDSTYSNVTTHVSLGYSLGPKGKLTALLSTEKSNDLTNGTSNGIESYSNLFYGLSYSFKKMGNDLIFPIKFQFNMDGMLGSRNSGQLTTSQARFLLRASYLFSINAKNYIFVQNQSGLLNSDTYLTNELFRIGGINNIRGVNEESIFASAYSVFNLEYRFKPNESSYFYSISDFSYAENKIDDQKINVISLGLGYAFITRAGVLNLSYAIGKFDNTPFTFENSKVHIKIISNF